MNKKIFAAVVITVLLMTTVFGSSGFVDVPEDAYYAEAVNWAVANGITFGTDATHFSPDEPCTRAQMITFLWRMAQNDVMDEEPMATTLPVEETPAPTPDPTPTPTQKPRTLADLEYYPPAPNPTIQPDFALDYYGRMYIGDIYSVGLYDTLSQQLVDLSDAGSIMKLYGGCYMVGDHDSEGLWIIRWCGPGDTMKIVKKDGTVETYEWQKTDAHVRNVGADVLDDDDNSCFKLGYDLFIATCNDSTGYYMTATFWNKVSTENP